MEHAIDAYRIVEELSAARAYLEILKHNHHDPRCRVEAAHHAAGLYVICRQLFTSVDHVDRMHAAAIIADAACCIDDLKIILPIKEHTTAGMHAVCLHNIAVAFAGDRVSEIYGKEEKAA